MKIFQKQYNLVKRNKPSNKNKGNVDNDKSNNVFGCVTNDIKRDKMYVQYYKTAKLSHKNKRNVNIDMKQAKPS